MMNRCLIILLLICYINDIARSTEIRGPLIYPEIKTTNSNPPIIWENINIDNDKKTESKYRITLQTADKKFNKEYLMVPEVFYKRYYVYKIPDPLENFEYSCRIERLVWNKPTESKYFYYLKYPIIFNFTIDRDDKNSIDYLPPEHLIRYIYIKKNNVAINGYNTFFLGVSGSICLGLGFLFLEVFTFGIISTILYTIFFIAAATGYSIGCYYGYRYFHYKNELRKIIDLGSNTSIKGGSGDGSINTGVELSF